MRNEELGMRSEGMLFVEKQVSNKKKSEVRCTK